jgi:hypothetical protein
MAMMLAITIIKIKRVEGQKSKVKRVYPSRFLISAFLQAVAGLRERPADNEKNNCNGDVKHVQHGCARRPLS